LIPEPFPKIINLFPPFPSFGTCGNFHALPRKIEPFGNHGNQTTSEGIMIQGKTHHVKDIAGRYSVAVDKVLDWIAKGELVAINVSTNPNGKRPRWRVTQEELERFEQSRATKPPAPKPPKRRRRSPAVKDYFATVGSATEE
jgi:hypothetical protein